MSNAKNLAEFGKNVGDSGSLTLDSSGNLGIGTSAPQRKMHIKGTVEEVIRLESGTAGAIHFFEGTSRRGILGYSSGGTISGNASAGDTVLRTESGTKLHMAVAGTSRLVIDSSGKVGIGPISPTQELDVTGNVVASSGFRIGNDSSWKIRPNNGNTDMAFEYATSSTLNDANIKAWLDSSGRMRKPYHPFFHAYGSGTTTKSSGTEVFAFSNTHQNIGSHYNTSNSRFTAPVDGRYLFSFMARVDGADVDYFRSYIRINGSTSFTVGHAIKDLGTNWDPRYYSFTGTTIYELAANDYVEIAIYSNGDTSYTHYGSESSFYGYLLG